MQFPIFLFLQVVVTAAAFSVHHKTIVAQKYKTALSYHPETFERAVDCASNYGMCNVDELLNLAKDLEEYQGCFYEDESEEACLKEAADRKDLSDLLLLQGEMQERMHYLKEGNLFAFDVQADRDMHERDDFIDKIAPSLDV